MSGPAPPRVRLDSSDPAHGWSFTPDAPPAYVLRCDALDGPAVLSDADGQPIQTWPAPPDALATLTAFARIQRGTWVGFIAYEAGTFFETLPVPRRDTADLPVFVFAFFPTPTDPVTRADADRPSEPAVANDGVDHSHALASSFTKADYLGCVDQVVDYIRAGDVFQINLAQRFTLTTDRTAVEIYRALLDVALPAYGALLDFGDFALVSQSPELFFRVDPSPDGTRAIVNRPIKGTRPLTPGMAEALRESEKDQAELAMIVDLQRNDLGRVCEIGSVRVTEPRAIEAHATVYHGVATVEGTLRPDVDFLDILRALFPCGSITGCPKIRAIEIIRELEPLPRGPYCGAIGRINADGSMVFSVAIRTIVLAGGVARVAVGGGIVADSVPADEYDETLVKARGMFAALGVARSPAVPHDKVLPYAPSLSPTETANQIRYMSPGWIFLFMLLPALLFLLRLILGRG